MLQEITFLTGHVIDLWMYDEAPQVSELRFVSCFFVGGLHRWDTHIIPRMLREWDLEM